MRSDHVSITSPSEFGSCFQQLSSRRDRSCNPGSVGVSFSDDDELSAWIHHPSWSVLQDFHRRNSSSLMSIIFFVAVFHTLTLGGTVSARSVKILLDRINNAEEPETRDNWWTEIRMEIRSHARALGCNAILGYEEHTSIW